jgi:hypothetical protein
VCVGFHATAVDALALPVRVAQDDPSLEDMNVQ